jgi:outer membrane protein assembly factor BamB
VLLGVRLSACGQLALTLGADRAGRRERALYTFPALGVVDVVEASLAFGRALVRGILRRDRAQCTNLRLSAFRRNLRESGDALREVCRRDAKINPTPEPYRAFAETARQRGNRTSDGPSPSIAQARLRYAARWRALVPGIDLRSTFLCGDRMIVGGAQETFCLARATGDVMWRAPTQKATSVVTPGGVARLLHDGTLHVHDFGTGEITLRAKLTPRAFAPPAGAVVNMPGLPRLLIVTEGEQHLVAIDLTSGEARWRFTWGKSAPSKNGAAHAGALRMKRAGKLLYFTCGDSALTALDVLTGAVVWRARDRMRFRVAPTLDHDALFALAGGAGSVAQLHAIDPYSGHARWTRTLPEPAAPCTIEGAPLAAAGVVALAVRERNGLSLVAFDRDTGEPRWTTPGPVAPLGTSWLAIDDLIVGNTPTADLVGVEAASGQLRYRHVLGPRAIETDVPRRLEPVLRSGALFVPHTDVHVIRPRDGATLATIAPCEAIPDLLRVDERCDVYVAEESGHLVSFTAQTRLSLVSG